jgi:hypothetical protein
VSRSRSFIARFGRREFFGEIAMLCLQLSHFRCQVRLEKTRKALTRDRARAVADLCFDFLELPACGRGFAALPVHRLRQLGLEAREGVLDLIPSE